MVRVSQRRIPRLREAQIAPQKEHQRPFVLPFALVIELVEQQDVRPDPLQNRGTVMQCGFIGLQGGEQAAGRRAGATDVEGSHPNGGCRHHHRLPLLRQG